MFHFLSNNINNVYIRFEELMPHNLTSLICHLAIEEKGGGYNQASPHWSFKYTLKNLIPF